MTEPRIAAVVVDHGTPDDTWLAVRALQASRRRLGQIVVVDNGSPRGPVALPAPDGGAITRLATGANLGFSGGTNAGVREALVRGAELVLLVNSDVVLPPDACGLLEAALDAQPDAGIAGPVLLSRSHPERVLSLGISYTPASGRMRHRGFGTRCSALALPPVEAVDAVSGCVMLVRREVFDRVGLLDEAYFFSFEDLDFCLRARGAGYATVLAGGAVAYHEGSLTIGARSARRMYFATRNHLRLARQAAPATPAPAALARTASIVILNVAHAVLRSEAALLPALAGAVRGAWHHALGRYGSGARQ
jgi:GT2 family glycosyltransferase